jgi:phenylalanyl-tRNA synthetase alpha chain
MDLREYYRKALEELSSIQNLKDLEEWRVQHLGRKSPLARVGKELSQLSISEKRLQGKEFNQVKRALDKSYQEVFQRLGGKGCKYLFDITVPGSGVAVGHMHILTRVQNDVCAIFSSLGFEIVSGPLAETEFYNFDALNIPQDHPARDLWDTIWLKHPTVKLQSSNPTHRNTRLLLRTHTSPVQIRYMESHTPPLRIIVPGKVFRFEATDQNHEVEFHQVEGLMVGKDVSFANMKFIIEEFFKKFFKKNIVMRLRASFFPFVEPGVEIDIQLDKESLSNQNARRYEVPTHQRKTEWLEVMGAGMVHPEVFKNAGYANGEWQGFAFGMGLERLAMIKYGIPDIRLFHSGDLRFIEQF